MSSSTAPRGGNGEGHARALVSPLPFASTQGATSAPASGGSQLPALSDLLAVDAEAVEGAAVPAEPQLEDVVQLLQGKVVRNNEDAGDDRADAKENGSQREALRSLGHPDRLPAAPPSFCRSFEIHWPVGGSLTQTGEAEILFDGEWRAEVCANR